MSGEEHRNLLRTLNYLVTRFLSHCGFKCIMSYYFLLSITWICCAPAGIQSFCRDIVEVADLLEKSSAVEEKGGAQQLAHIHGRLQEVFTKHGLEKMSPVGGQYDPYQHEIVCHTPAEGTEPGTVAVVKQDGYMLHGRTIRHALVGIAVKTQEHWQGLGLVLSCLTTFDSVSVYETSVLTSLDNIWFTFWCNGYLYVFINFFSNSVPID